jgi:hypothetical protein
LLVTAKKEGGALPVSSTGANHPMLAGNVVALRSPLILVPVLSYGFGTDNYNFECMKSTHRADDSDMASKAHVNLELVPGSMDLDEVQEREEQSAGSLSV